jgi:hypothetical protein
MLFAILTALDLVRTVKHIEEGIQIDDFFRDAQT